MEPVSVTRFREYLRIKTVQPNPDYHGCTNFLKRYAEELGLEFRVIECVAGKPIVIMTLLGSQPDLKSIILNSHTDVVPVSEVSCVDLGKLELSTFWCRKAREWGYCGQRVQGLI